MSSLHKQSFIATIAILGCRFTGLMREICFTSIFGATGALDAFLTAFRIPNMLRDMLGEGALSQSFTSEMSKVERTQGREEAWKLANRVCSQLIALMLCIVSVGVLLAGAFMQKLYPEQAQIVLQVQEAKTDANQDKIIYLGESVNRDGLKQITFSCAQKPEAWSESSCVSLEDFPHFELGQSVKLSSHQLEGGVAITQRNYMQMAADLCRIMWPYILFASIAALGMGALFVFGIFGLPNISSAVFNITTIGLGSALGWWIDPSFGPDALYGFAIAIVCGGAAQIPFLLPRLKKEGFKPQWDIGLRWQKGTLHFCNKSTRKVWALMIPGLISAGITQFNIFVNTAFALYLPDGSVTALSSAFRLWQLPVALFGVAIGMVVLPAVARMRTQQENASRDIAHHLAIAIRLSAFLALPCMIFLGLWGEEIVSVFFQRGRFDEAASVLTGQVLSAYALGLLCYAATKVLQPVFLALEKPWAPAFLALFSCVISISLNYLFVHYFHLSAAWLALTTSTVTTLTFVFYFIYLRHLLGGMDMRTLITGLTRIGLAGCVLALSCMLIKLHFLENFIHWSFLHRFIAMAIGGVVTASLYFLASALLRVPELRDLANNFKRKKA